MPFSVTVSASSTAPAIGVPVTFTAVPASGITVESYAWSFGDGAVATTTGAIVSHAYASPGNKVVSVTATSSDGATGTGQTIVTVTPVTLTVTAAPSPVTRNDVVTLTTTITPSTTAVQQYEWNFGDGSSILSTNAGTTTHIYTSAAPYTIRVTATLTDGSKVIAQTELVVN